MSKIDRVIWNEGVEKQGNNKQVYIAVSNQSISPSNVFTWCKKTEIRQVKVEMHNIQLKKKKKELSNLTSVQVKCPKSQLWLNKGIPPKEIPKIL